MHDVLTLNCVINVRSQVSFKEVQPNKNPKTPGLVNV